MERKGNKDIVRGSTVISVRGNKYLEVLHILLENAGTYKKYIFHARSTLSPKYGDNHGSDRNGERTRKMMREKKIFTLNKNTQVGLNLCNRL